MSSYTSISPDKLARLIGTAKTPALIDVRTDEDFAADPRLIPAALRHRKRVLEPSRGALHLRRHGRGVWSRDPADAAARDHGARSRYRAARFVAGGARPACGFTGPVANV